MIDSLLQSLRTYRLSFTDENEMQAAVSLVLDALGIKHSREYSLGAKGTIDLYTAHRIGIECKVAGGPSAVCEQIVRYASHDDIDGIILVTSRQSHRFISEEVCGKPVRVLHVGGLGL